MMTSIISVVFYLILKYIITIKLRERHLNLKNIQSIKKNIFFLGFFFAYFYKYGQIINYEKIK